MNTEQPRVEQDRQDDGGGPRAVGVPQDSSGEVAKTTSSSKRVLEPIERISEVLFGLIMVLTFTCSFSIAESGRSEIRTMLLAALGCNLAWGIIDAIMYLMSCLAERARSLGLLRAVRSTANPEKAQSLIAGALSPIVASNLGPSELERIRLGLMNLPEPPAHPSLGKKDWAGAIAVFIL